jgi:hypothetical protein
VRIFSEKEQRDKKTKMSLLCSKCGDEARFLCGHGCGTAYCAEPCALVSYNVHKTECTALVGVNYPDDESMYAYINQGTPDQKYQRVREHFSAVWDAVENATFFTKHSVKKYKDAFIKVASSILLQKDMSRYKNNILLWVQQIQQRSAVRRIGEEEIGEGAVDVLRDENAFFNSLNLRLETSRRNVIRDTFVDLEITYEKHKKDLLKGGLKNKINYFVRALRRVIIEKGQVKTLGEKLSSKEEAEYARYIQQAETWLATLEKKK